MKIPLLGSSESVLIDFDDRRKVTGFTWCKQAGRLTNYASARINGRKTLMHRWLMDTPEGVFVDHINNNGLDNRRENLRLCTPHENSMGQGVNPNRGTSKYKGVYLHNSGPNPWVAEIKHNRKLHYLGCFKTEKDAARAYNEAAEERFGAHAFLNPIL